ncbi:unnamed protein product [Amoebophrya sp. A25]|nr:unnamed protein product [Amoebophrya sp. A25]|eukprot:GSA25T00025030001.1
MVLRFLYTSLSLFCDGLVRSLSCEYDSDCAKIFRLSYNYISSFLNLASSPKLETKSCAKKRIFSSSRMLLLVAPALVVVQEGLLFADALCWRAEPGIEHVYAAHPRTTLTTPLAPWLVPNGGPQECCPSMSKDPGAAGTPARRDCFDHIDSAIGRYNAEELLSDDEGSLQGEDKLQKGKLNNNDIASSLSEENRALLKDMRNSCCHPYMRNVDEQHFRHFVIEVQQGVRDYLADYVLRVRRGEEPLRVKESDSVVASSPPKPEDDEDTLMLKVNASLKDLAGRDQLLLPRDLDLVTLEALQKVIIERLYRHFERNTLSPEGRTGDVFGSKLRMALIHRWKMQFGKAGAVAATSGEPLSVSGATGAWDGAAAAGYHMHDGRLSAAIVDLIRRRIEQVDTPSAALTSLDFGCGLGYYVRDLRKSGLSAFGLDGNPATEEISEGRCRLANFVEPLFCRLPRQEGPEAVRTQDDGVYCRPRGSHNATDVVLSLEVGEHIPPEFERTFLDNLAKHARSLLILSWGNQPGTGHYNNLPIPAVVPKVLRALESQRNTTRSVKALHGRSSLQEMTPWMYDAREARALRSASTLPWFEHTLMVFRRMNAVAS